jgi:hypothetical protein
LSHFIAATGRWQLWWAYGQIEALWRSCVNLARLRRHFSGEVDGYDKVEQVMSGEHFGNFSK